MELTKTLQRKISNNRCQRFPAAQRCRSHFASSSSGFSLLEILIVVALIAGLMAGLIPRLRKPDSDIQKVARHLMVLGRDIRNQARLKSRTFRLVFRLEGTQHRYWVESAPGRVIPKTAVRLEEELRLPEDKRPKEAFEKETRFSKDAFEMPKDLFFALIETPTQKDGVSEGLGYIYFSPEGLVEPAAVQITNRKQLTWTLVYSPLTGHADIIPRAVRLKDVKQD